MGVKTPKVSAEFVEKVRTIVGTSEAIDGVEEFGEEDVDVNSDPVEDNSDDVEVNSDGVEVTSNGVEDRFDDVVGVDAESEGGSESVEVVGVSGENDSEGSYNEKSGEMVRISKNADSCNCSRSTTRNSHKPSGTRARSILLAHR